MLRYSLLFLLLAVPGWCAHNITVFFNNDGNWTTHSIKPSALFVNDPASHDQAASICTSYSETLLNCSAFSDFPDQFGYQEYLGNLQSDQEFWSSCSRPVSSSGSVAGNSSSSSRNNNNSSLPFLCTNTAPFVGTVNTDYSNFPTINVTSSNGSSFQGLRDHMAFRFIGIPFGQPPLGDLRLVPSVAYNGSSNINATRYKPACPQYGDFDGDSNGLNPWGNSEDCLYLNVYTSSLPSSDDTPSKLKPVMFWIYGGASVTGSAADSTFDGASLVSRSDVVIVTTNYRLNILGGLTLNDGVITGNQALSDKILALKWVQKYITAFGGDPTNVTIFGQSSGAASVIDLSVSPKAAGLFSGGIVQSAGKGHTSYARQLADEVLPYIEPLCNSTGTERLKCLQKLPTETLLNITTVASTWKSVVDHIYITDLPYSQVAKGKFHINKMHMLAGFMADECQSLLGSTIAPNDTGFAETLQTTVDANYITQGQADSILVSGLWAVSNETYTNGTIGYTSAYNATVNAVTDGALTCMGLEYTRIGAAVNAYDSMWIYKNLRGYGLNYSDPYGLCTFPVGKPDTPYYKCHASDLYEVWGTAYLFGLPIRDAYDVYYDNAMQDMWASFARSGNPNPSSKYLGARGYTSSKDFFDQFSWPQFTAMDQLTAHLQFPDAFIGGLPDQEHCQVILPETPESLW